MSAPTFTFTDLQLLLAHLAQHSSCPPESVEFDVKLTVCSMDSMFQNTGLAVTSPVSVKVNTRATGIRGIQELFGRAANDEIKLHTIRWKAGGHALNIYLEDREIILKTDSISFVEIIRHLMTGRHVRRFTVDLKMP